METREICGRTVEIHAYPTDYGWAAYANDPDALVENCVDEHEAVERVVELVRTVLSSAAS